MKTFIVKVALIGFFTAATLSAAPAIKEGRSLQPTHNSTIRSEKNIRQITDDEFNGTAPIQLGLNEELLIPMNLTANTGGTISFGESPSINIIAQDQNVLDVSTTEPTLSINTSNISFIFNILCNSVAVGSTTVSIGCMISNAPYKKELTINVVE